MITSQCSKNPRYAFPSLKNNFYVYFIVYFATLIQYLPPWWLLLKFFAIFFKNKAFVKYKNSVTGKEAPHSLKINDSHHSE